jgi:hypothetical protein
VASLTFLPTGITAGADTNSPYAGRTYTLPSGTTSGDLLVGFYGGKPYDTVPSIPSGYTAQSGGANGTTANGNGSGSVYAVAFTKTHSGSESDPSSTMAAGYSPAITAMLAIQPDSAVTWAVTSTKGSDSAATGTNFSATGESTLDYTTGDVVVVQIVHNDDSSGDSGFRLSIPGCVVSTPIQRLTGTLTTSTGNDGRMYVLTAGIISGTATGAPTVTATTGSGDSDGQAVFLRASGASYAPAAKAETFTDDFADGIGSHWNNNGGSPTVVDGAMSQTVSTSWTASWTPNDGWSPPMAAPLDLTDSHVFAQVGLPAVGSAGGQWRFNLLNNIPLDSVAIFMDSSDKIQGYVKKSNSTVFTGTAGPTYNPTTHAWLRIREASGTVYFDHSADGVTWTNFDSTTHTVDLTNVFIEFGAQMPSGTDTMTVDNVNVAGSSGTPGTASGSLSLGASATAAAAGSAGGSLSLGGSAAAAAAGTATASGSLTLSGSATGAAVGTASGSLALAGDAVASTDAAGSLTLGGSATGTVSITAGGALTLGGTALGAAAETATGALTLDGAAVAAGAGTATGDVTLSGTATGQAATTGAGSLALSGIADGGASGAASGTLTLDGLVAAGLLGQATGEVTLGGQATGLAAGQAAGGLSLTGYALAGADVAASGLLSLSGLAAADGSATAAGHLALAGTAVPDGYVVGWLELVGTATGAAQTLSPGDMTGATSVASMTGASTASGITGASSGVAGITGAQTAGDIQGQSAAATMSRS